MDMEHVIDINFDASMGDIARDVHDGLAPPQLINSPLDIRPRSRRFDEFPWLGRRLVPDAYRTASLILSPKRRFAVQHSTRSHMAQMRPEVVRNDVWGTGFGEADAFGGPWLIEIVPFTTNLAKTLSHNSNTHLSDHPPPRGNFLMLFGRIICCSVGQRVCA